MACSPPVRLPRRRPAHLRLLFDVASRAGFPLIVTGSTSVPYDTLTPAFTLHPGESGLTAVRRLIEKVTDVLFFDSGYLIVTEPQATDTSQYSFGPDTHAIIEGRYRDLGPAINRARTVGAGVYGEAFDFREIEAFGESIATPSTRTSMTLTTRRIVPRRCCATPPLPRAPTSSRSSACTAASSCTTWWT